jgi:pimeloyl-ACP methyl ester carboxylesterase
MYEKAVNMNTQTVKDDSTISTVFAPASFIDFPDGRRIAYRLTEGSLPGVVFLGGFNSDMNGSKALYAEALCKARGTRFLRFNYSGHGSSSGRFIDGTIGAWKQDALDMIDALAPGANILIGSSMGGWIMLLVALARTERIKGLLGIASAPDFTEELLWKTATGEQKAQLQSEGVIYVPNCYGGEPYPITMTLIEEGRKHLLLHDTVGITAPVRLLHGTRDEDVPWNVSQRLLEKLASPDGTLTLVKDAGHRLSEPNHLEMIEKLLTSLQKP